MVVWEDRGVLKPPNPPTVHATDYYTQFMIIMVIMKQFYAVGQSTTHKIMLVFNLS